MPIPSFAAFPVAWIRRLPPLIRFMLLHGLIGFGLAALFMVALVWADPGGVGSLIWRAPGHPLPLLLLWFFSGLTFGSVQIGAAAMLLEAPRPKPPRDEDDDDHWGGGRLIPIPVPARRRR